jgi:hypothetical protein
MNSFFIKVSIILTSELIFREEYDPRWLRYYLEKFNLNFAQASVTIHPPPLPVPPTPTPLVPSTPIPEGLIFGSRVHKLQEDYLMNRKGHLIVMTPIPYLCYLTARFQNLQDGPVVQMDGFSRLSK